jgi:hypothetical protein
MEEQEQPKALFVFFSSQTCRTLMDWNFPETAAPKSALPFHFVSAATELLQHRLGVC